MFVDFGMRLDPCSNIRPMTHRNDDHMGPLKDPGVLLKDPRGPFKGPRGPFKGPRPGERRLGHKSNGFWGVWNKIPAGAPRGEVFGRTHLKIISELIENWLAGRKLTEN